MVIMSRVPYLDPSFEALVKIQLRFCAEAYSRMAQVQQYVLPPLFAALSRCRAYIAGLQVSGCIDTRSVRERRPGCEGGRCAGPDKGVEYCWNGIEQLKHEVRRWRYDNEGKG